MLPNYDKETVHGLLLFQSLSESSLGLPLLGGAFKDVRGFGALGQFRALYILEIGFRVSALTLGQSRVLGFRALYRAYKP